MALLPPFGHRTNSIRLKLANDDMPQCQSDHPLLPYVEEVSVADLQIILSHPPYEDAVDAECTAPSRSRSSLRELLLGECPIAAVLFIRLTLTPAPLWSRLHRRL